MWTSDVYIFTQQIWNTCLHDSNSKESLNSYKSNCVKPKFVSKKAALPHFSDIKQRNKSRTRTFINCLVKPTSLITSLSQRTSVECVTQYSFMTVWNKRGGLDPLMVSNVWDASEDSGIDRLFSSWTQPWQEEPKNQKQRIKNFHVTHLYKYLLHEFSYWLNFYGCVSQRVSVEATQHETKQATSTRTWPVQQKLSTYNKQRWRVLVALSPSEHLL